jgi:DNA-binding transcriptional ArsR family regulator
LVTPVLERAEDIAALLSILGNTKRLLIMAHLREGEMSVGTIAARVDLSQSALSQHLAKLRAQNLVATRRDKQTIYYSFSSPQARDLLDALDTLFGEGAPSAKAAGKARAKSS